jgi:hypothetical protein
MHYFRIAVATRINHVNVALSDDQVKSRAGRRGIEPVEKQPGVYAVTEPMDFKAGEIIGLDGAPPKHLLRYLESDEAGVLLTFDPKEKANDKDKKPVGTFEIPKKKVPPVNAPPEAGPEKATKPEKPAKK